MEADVACAARTGSTETTGSITGVDWDFLDETASHGAPFSNVKLRLVDENDNDVEPGQPGEILVDGPIVCQGEHGGQAKTCFDNPLIGVDKP